MSACALFLLPCHWAQLRRAGLHLLYWPPQVPIHTDLVPPRLLFTPTLSASLCMTWKSDSTITKKSTFDWMMLTKGVNAKVKPQRGTISRHQFRGASYHITCLLKLNQFEMPLSTSHSFLSHSGKAACQLLEQQCSNQQQPGGPDAFSWAPTERPSHTAEAVRTGWSPWQKFAEKMSEQDRKQRQEKYLISQLKTALKSFRVLHHFVFSTVHSCREL